MTEVEQKRIDNMLAWYKENRSNYLEFSKVVLEKIKKALDERGIFIASSSCRAKTPTSLESKCKKTVWKKDTNEYQLKYSDPKSQIMDFAGARIVAYLNSDVQLICKIVENLFEIDYENSGDKRAILSENEIGYLSVHYIVSLKEYSFENKKFKGYKCEVQIRTVLQDAWAQIFHDRQYKNNLTAVEPDYDLRRNTSLVAGALELIDNQIDLLVHKYDSLSKTGIANAAYQELLDSSITLASVSQYCKLRFLGQVNRYYNADVTISILKDCGFETIRDIDNIVQESFVEAVTKANQITIDKLITYLLIISNVATYFSLPHDKIIKSISKESYDLLNAFVNMENICDRYHVKIEE